MKILVGIDSDFNGIADVTPEVEKKGEGGTGKHFGPVVEQGEWMEVAIEGYTGISWKMFGSITSGTGVENQMGGGPHKLVLSILFNNNNINDNKKLVFLRVMGTKRAIKSN